MKKGCYYKDPNIGFQMSPFDSALNEPVKTPLPEEWRNDGVDEGAPEDDSE